jgi:hypothetical protein
MISWEPAIKQKLASKITGVDGRNALCDTSRNFRLRIRVRAFQLARDPAEENLWHRWRARRCKRLARRRSPPHER